MKNKRLQVKDITLKNFKELLFAIHKADKTEFNNKYDEIVKNLPKGKKPKKLKPPGRMKKGKK